MPLVTKSFANAVSFTRASNATYFDSTGMLKRAASNASRIDYNPSTLAVRGLLVEESRTNLITYSEDFNNSAWTKTNLTVIPNVVASPAGNISADLMIPNTTGSVDHLILSNVTSVSSGVAHTISVFLKAEGYSWARISFGGVAGGGYAFFNLSTGVVGTVQTTSSASASIQSVGNGWYRCTYTRTTTTSGGLNIDLYAQSADNQFGWAGNGTSGIYVWGAQLEAGAFATSYIPSTVTFSGRTSSGTYFDSAGILQTATSGVARTTYNPANVGAEPFLLLEESRTNSIRNNTMQGAVAGTPGTLPTNWGVGGVGALTQTIVGTGTANGINYIDLRFNGTTSTTQLTVRWEGTGIIPASNGQAWATSVFVALQAGSISNITQLFVSGNIFDGANAYINDVAQIGNIINSISATLTRFSGSGTINAVGAASIRPYISLTFASGVAIDITLRIGMPQLEQGAYSTSVIPTSSAAVTRAADTSSSTSATRSADTSTSATATRAADVVSINTLSPWYNASAGTLYAEYARPSPAAQMFAAEISDNTFNEFIGIYTDTAPNIIAQIRDNGGSQAFFNLVSGVGTANVIYKQVLAMALNDFAACSNGGTVGTDTVGTLPTVTRLNIGNFNGFSQFANGWIRRIAYYPRRLTNAELQALTT